MTVAFRSRAFTALVAASLLAPATTVAHRAHTHGVADLDIALDGGRLTLVLTAPADDVVGFEHAPRTDAQRAAVAAAERLLADHAALFSLPAAAGCAMASTDVRAPWREGEPAADGHADFIAQWSFDCARPAELRQFDVRIAEKLRGNLRLRTTVISDRGQQGLELRRNRTRVSL